MKLAILFPGIGYHTDKPLLYYSKKILKNMDYEIKEIHFVGVNAGTANTEPSCHEQQQVQDYRKPIQPSPNTNAPCCHTLSLYYSLLQPVSHCREKAFR